MITDDGPDEPIDDTDLQILAELGDLWDTLDPVPDDLTLEIRFRLSVQALHAEVAELHGDADDGVQPTSQVPELAGAGAFRDGAPVRTDTLTFRCDQLSSMVTVASLAADMVRVDGWVTVPECAVEMRVLARDRRGRPLVHQTRADEVGRYTFDEVETGPAQLVFRYDDITVMTPYFAL